jgi:hypothetical protein
MDNPQIGPDNKPASRIAVILNSVQDLAYTPVVSLFLIFPQTTVR